MSEQSDMSTDKLLSWVKNGKPENPKTRMGYGGVTKSGYLYIKTNKGEVLTFPLHSK